MSDVRCTLVTTAQSLSQVLLNVILIGLAGFKSLRVTVIIYKLARSNMWIWTHNLNCVACYPKGLNCLSSVLGWFSSESNLHESPTLSTVSKWMDETDKSSLHSGATYNLCPKTRYRITPGVGHSSIIVNWLIYDLMWRDLAVSSSSCSGKINQVLWMAASPKNMR